MKKTVLAVAAALTILLLLASCTKKASPNGGYSIDNYYSSPEARKDSEFYSMISSEPDEEVGQKLTINAQISAETKQYADSLERIAALVKSAGGYVSSSSQSDMLSKYNRRRAEMTLRVPSEKFEDFIRNLSEIVSITSQETNINDITESYYSAKSSYDSLLIQEERLLTMLEKADKLADMLVIEDKLAEVRQKIQYYETQLKTYDNKVTYSTVSLYVNEVAEYTEPEKETFWSRISNAFSTSWEDFGLGCQDFAVWLVSALPALVVIAVIAVVIVVIIKSAKRNHSRKQEKKRLKIAAAYAERQKQADGTNQN